MDLSEVHSESPHFQCVSCNSTFAANLSNPQNEVILGQKIQSDNTLGQSGLGQKRSCMKCGALNFLSSEECYSCGVVFDKLKSAPQANEKYITPELVKRWGDVLGRFEDTKVHQLFIRRASELNGLNFARDKYQAILDAHPSDEMALVMKKNVESKIQDQLRAAVEKQKMPYKRLAYATPYLMGVFFVTYGMASLGQRNFVGLGVVILFLSLAFDKFLREIIFQDSTQK